MSNVPIPRSKMRREALVALLVLLPNLALMGVGLLMHTRLVR